MKELEKRATRLTLFEFQNAVKDAADNGGEAHGSLRTKLLYERGMARPFEAPWEGAEVRV